MATDQQLVITLPAEVADLIHRKVSSGEYANESEVVRESLAFLEGQEEQRERWLREEVVPACMEFDADPSSGFSAAELLSGLEADRKERQRPA